MPDDRYSDEAPEGGRYGDEPRGERRYDDERRFDDRDLRNDGGGSIPNYLTQSILVTLFCCWPFGIAAIVNAAKVNTFIAQGNYREAQEASDAAKKWCTVSMVIGLIWVALVVGVQCLGAMNGGGR